MRLGLHLWQREDKQAITTKKTSILAITTKKDVKPSGLQAGDTAGSREDETDNKKVTNTALKH
jgi:hypothetical protein